MVSPTIMQNATIPPNALFHSGQCFALRHDLDTAHLQCPLRHGNGNQPRLAKAVFNRTLKRVGPAKLGVDYDELDCPVDGDCKGDQEEYAGEESGLEERVRLTDDAGSTMQC